MPKSVYCLSGFTPNAQFKILYTPLTDVSMAPLLLLLVTFHAFTSCSTHCSLKMAGFRSLAPKTKNLVVAGGLSAFVLGVYYYTMRAVGGTDELQVAIDKFEEMKKKDAGNSSTAGS